jgi:hypothetical protein
VRITQRSMKFSSSRMLPGQSAFTSAAVRDLKYPVEVLLTQVQREIHVCPDGSTTHKSGASVFLRAGNRTKWY